MKYDTIRACVELLEAENEQMIAQKAADRFRVLHTADWHLGKMLDNESRDEEHAEFLAWLLGVVSKHSVDAIILAGDVFDNANPPQSAQKLYYNFVSELHRKGTCELVVVGGNHDSAGQLEAPRQVLECLKVRVVGQAPEDPAERILLLPSDEDPMLAVALVPFLRDSDLRLSAAGEGAAEIQAKVVAGIREHYARTAEATSRLSANLPAIATGHLTVAGTKSSDSEREIHIGGLGAVSPDVFPQTFGYVALGHLHRPQEAEAGGRVRYAGSPIPLSFSESTDQKEVRILDVGPGGVVQQALPVPVFRRLAQLRTSYEQLAQSLEAFQPQAADLPTWVELVVETAPLDYDLNQRVQELAAGRDFIVLKVLRQSRDEQAALAGEGVESVDDILLNPRTVFAQLLKDKGIEEASDEAGELTTTFNRLVEMVEQSTPGEAA